MRLSNISLFFPFFLLVFVSLSKPEGPFVRFQGFLGFLLV